MKHPNVMIVIESLRQGGAERVTANLSAHLAKRGASVSIVTISAADEDFYPLHGAVRRLWLDAVAAHSLRQKLSANLRRLWVLRKIIKRERPDVVIGMMTRSAIFAALVSVGLKTKVIVSERNHPPRSPLPRRWAWLRLATYRLSDGAVALTRLTAEWMEQRAGCRNVAVIPVSLDWPLARLTPTLNPQDFVPASAFVFLSVGRLHWQKGHDLLIEAFNRVSNRHPQATLIILGEGGERQRLESRVDALGLTGRVILPGRAGNVSDWYARADVFVFSSRWEGFGNALVEAMASGLPCISFNCGGPGEVIDDGTSGLLVEPQDTVAMALAMNRLVEDPNLRRRLRTAAAQCLETYSDTSIMPLWDDVIMRVSPT